MVSGGERGAVTGTSVPGFYSPRPPLRRLVTEFLQSSELLFKAALAGHVGKFNAF